MIMDNYRKRFDELFKDIDEKKAELIDESTLKIIDHVHTRVSYTESKRRAALEIGLAFLTFSVAAGVLLNNYSKELLDLFLPLIVSLSIVGFIVVSLYALQARFKRPFIENARTWRWFYHYCINPELPVGPLLNHEKRQKSKQGYLEGLFRYAKNTLSTSSKTRLGQDIEQLFILLTGERLKNEFLKQLQGVFFYGIIASLLSFMSNLLLSSYGAPILEFFYEYRQLTSLLIFLIVLSISLKRKVFRATKSREPWQYIDVPENT